MSYASSLSTKVEKFNFVNIFNRSAETRSSIVFTIREQASNLDDLVSWINNTSILTVVEATTLPTGRFFKNDRLVVRFQLAHGYQNNFGLLRGLFGFTRPKNLEISSIFVDRVFELQLSANETGTITRYLEEILVSIKSEIRFKESLKTVIDFEQRVRKEQAKVYSALKPSVDFSLA